MKRKLNIHQLTVQSFVTELSKVKGGVTPQSQYCGTDGQGCGDDSAECSQTPSVCVVCYTPMCTVEDACWTDPY